MSTFAFVTTGSTFTLAVDGNSRGTWTRNTEVEGEFNFQIAGNSIVVNLQSPYLTDIIKPTDTITVDTVEVTGTLAAKLASLKAGVFFSPGYKNYVARLSQSGTAAPTATIFENSIGAIVWTRTSAGNYVGTLTGAFPAAKWMAHLTPAGLVTGYQFGAGRATDNTFAISTNTDGDLNNASLTIRVYN